MNGLLVPTPSALHPRHRGAGGSAGGGGGGAEGGAGAGGAGNSSRGSRGNAVGRPRGRARGGGSRLASSKPINQADLSPSMPTSIPNGEISDFNDTDFDSADDSDLSREDRFNKTAPGNRYEQVLTPLFFLRARKMSL